MTITCPLLQITLPGFQEPVNFTNPEIAPGFGLNLTACDFGTQTSNCGTSYAALSDGIYIIRYSVAPNDIVYVEYNHLRITCALNRVRAIYCDLDLGTCDPPSTIKDKLEKLRLIESYLKAAKAHVEFCHQPAKGMELFTYAVKLLDKFTCTSCKTC